MSHPEVGFESALEPVIEEFTTGEYYREVYNAKKEFFDRAGIVYEDDAEYDQRMSIFMDWYLFDRDLPGVDLPPVRYYFRKHRAQMDSEKTAIFEDLCKTNHSIFKLNRRTWVGKGLVITDLFTQKKYTIHGAEMSDAFSRGDLFEARLIPYRGEFHFSKGFCFHPVEMGSFISGEIKRVRFQDKPKQSKLILELSSMKLKHLRFPHIDIQHIYKIDSKL
jgi:hypothetical protein